MSRHPSKMIALEETKSILGTTSEEAIARLLDRATTLAVEAAKQRYSSPGRLKPTGKAGGTTVTDADLALRQALAYHVRNSGPQQSLRMASPKTGGRSFHFSITSIKGRTAKERKGANKAASHTRYIERPDAIEEAQREEERSVDLEAGFERDPADRMQYYIENPEKIEIKGQTRQPISPASSFGTIGDTLAERREFWALSEEYQGRGNPRLQYRVILGLPVEATIDQRREILRRYSDGLGLPYWAVLHAPTAANDPRNYHAHVVFSPRPAKKIWHPVGGDDGKQTPDGSPKPLEEIWDFAARTKPGRTDAGHNRWQHPFRKAIDPRLEQLPFIPDERKRFAEIVNQVCPTPDGTLRYDWRSYKNMGLEVEALKSVARTIIEKSKRGGGILIDKGHARRLTEVEIVRITRGREPELRDIAEISAAAGAGDRELRLLERSGKFFAKPALGGVGPALSSMIKRAALWYVKTRQWHIRRKITQAIEVGTIERVVAATDPTRMSAQHDVLDQRLRHAKKARQEKEVERLKAEISSIPSPDIIRHLNEAAQVELETVKSEQQYLSDVSFHRVRTALNGWKQLASGQVKQVIPIETGRPTVAGIAAPTAPTKVVEAERHVAPPMFTGVESVINQIFNTPQSRVMLQLYERFGEFISDNAEIDVPGRTALDLSALLIAAVKKGPLEAEQLMADAKFGALAPEIVGIGQDGVPVGRPRSAGPGATGVERSVKDLDAEPIPSSKPTHESPAAKSQAKALDGAGNDARIVNVSGEQTDPAEETDQVTIRRKKSRAKKRPSRKQEGPSR